ncbi:hypothetical protein Ddye_021751 [Dipteronia dyeriana]|uniref:Uncharacterized protein n=1 Tax=Dipteronia dyeriana TaxID=168575 RepID=A0AAD9U281_9ROSI|nr:hypothetical protein Ddye_021751 [Dipteronia dyeriana]
MKHPIRQSKLSKDTVVINLFNSASQWVISYTSSISVKRVELLACYFTEALIDIVRVFKTKINSECYIDTKVKEKKSVVVLALIPLLSFHCIKFFKCANIEDSVKFRFWGAVVRAATFIRVIGKIWLVKKGVDVESVTGNIFTFHFNDQEDRNHIPLLCMTKEIGRFLSEMIGKVVDVDGGAAGDCVGKFIRVRICINIEKPLRRCLWVDIMGDGHETIMLLMYERLINLCFTYGRVCHRTNEWTSDEPISMVDGVEKPLFGV